jgi:hypothetical protein
MPILPSKTPSSDTARSDKQSRYFETSRIKHALPTEHLISDVGRVNEFTRRNNVPRKVFLLCAIMLLRTRNRE